MERACRVCDCTTWCACETPTGPCYWVEYDLCSGCAPTPTAVHGSLRERLALALGLLTCGVVIMGGLLGARQLLRLAGQLLGLQP